MISRQRFPLVAWFVVMLLMFSQITTAAYICAPSGIVSMPMAMHGDMEMDGDCDMTPPKASPAACKAHCEKGSQASDTRVPGIAAPVLVALFFITPFLDVAVTAGDASPVEPPTLIAASPPLRLQYQVFRN